MSKDTTDRKSNSKQEDESTKYQFWKRGWWYLNRQIYVVCAICVLLLLVAPIVFHCIPHFLDWVIQYFTKTALVDDSQLLYLMSSVAQALAAVLALVFSILLIILQATTKYSRLVPQKVFESNWTKLTLFFFTITISFALLSMLYLNGGLAIITGNLAVVCFFFLICFMYRMKDWFRINNVFENNLLKIKEHAKKKGSKKEAPDENSKPIEEYNDAKRILRHVTDDPEEFAELANNFLNLKI